MPDRQRQRQADASEFVKAAARHAAVFGPVPSTPPTVTRHPNVTRIEVIDNSGRVFGGRYTPGAEIHVQDDGRTIKVFAEEGTGQQYDPYRGPYERLQRTLTRPPVGWFSFGTHVDQPDVKLEFWGTDDGGMPLWERPVSSGDRVQAVARALAAIPLGEFAEGPERIAEIIVTALDEHDARTVDR